MSTDPTKIRLEQTCDACPEQYNAYYGGRVVGYLRLRYGHFRVDYPNCGGDVVYSADIGNGLTGCFENGKQRQGYLAAAKSAIAVRMDLDKQEQK